MPDKDKEDLVAKGERMIDRDFPTAIPVSTPLDNNIITPTGQAANQVFNSMNNPVQALANNPVTDLLSKFSGNPNPQIGIDNFAPEPEYIGAGPQAFSTYFPSMQNDINKGYYSGSMIGSNPIYAPAQLYPFGLVDARQQALKKAADKKVAEQEAFARKIGELKAPETQHKAVQPEVTNMFYAGLQDDIAAAQKKYGQNWAKNLWADPTFHKKIQTVKDVAGYEDVAVKHVADVEHMSETGDYALTPAIQQKINDFKTGKYNLLSMSSDPEMQAEARKIFQLGPIKDAVKMSKDVASGIQPDIREGAPSLTSQGLYDMLVSTKTKSTSEQRIKDAVDNSWKSLYGGKEDLVGIDKNEYYKLVASNFGRERTTTTQTVSTKEGEGYNFHMDDRVLSKAPVSVASITGEPDKVGAYSLSDSYNIPANMQKSFEMTIPKTAKDVSGNVIAAKTTGNVTSTVSQVGNAVVIHKKGSKYDGKAIDYSNPETVKNWKDAGFEFTVVPQAVVTVEGYDEKGKKSPGQNSTIAVGLDHIRNNVMKLDDKGNYKSGVNIPLLEQKAKDFEKQLNAKGEKSFTPAQESLIKQNMDANPAYSRDEIIKALGL